MAQVYTSAMPVDVDAAVISNTRLSEDYSVIALAAPEVAALARPGQFVMVKTARGADPLLRRPFSIFEILRDDDRRPVGLTLLNKRIGAGTGRLYEAEAGARLACLGPLGRPFEPAAPPTEAWMIAGGVGLAPFVSLAEAIAAAGGTPRLFYGARRADDLYYVDLLREDGRTRSRSPPKTAAAATAATSPSRSTPACAPPPAATSGSTSAGRRR